MRPQLAHPSAFLPIIAKTLMSVSNPFDDVASIARRNGAPEGVVNILTKAAQGALNLDDPDFSGLADLGIASTAFIESLRSSSVFLRLLDDGLVRAPLRTRLSLSSFNTVGDLVPEGSAKPISKLEIVNSTLARRKATSIVVISREVAISTSTAAQALITRELRNAVVAALDAEFLTCLVDSNTPLIASDGTTAIAAGSDLHNLLAAVTTYAGSRLFLLAPPDVAKSMATLMDSGGQLVFAGMSPTGGEALGLPVLVSDQVTPGQLILVDASGVLGDIEGVTVVASRQASLQLDTAPTMSGVTPTPTDTVSLWQTNNVAVKASSWFGCERFRADAVAVLTSIQWGPVVGT